MVTASGKHKGRLTPADFVVIDEDGQALEGGTPSAETPLHALMFRLDPSIGAVIHSHSIVSTVLGMVVEGRASIDLEGYEMLKSLPGIESHAQRVSIPIFDNSQDVPAIARAVEARWRVGPFKGYVLRGHGLYGWGPSLDVAMRVIEGLEFLLACELERRKVR